MEGYTNDLSQPKREPTTASLTQGDWTDYSGFSTSARFSCADDCLLRNAQIVCKRVDHNIAGHPDSESCEQNCPADSRVFRRMPGFDLSLYAQTCSR